MLKSSQFTYASRHCGSITTLSSYCHHTVSNASPQLMTGTRQLMNASPQLTNAAPQLINALPQLMNASQPTCCTVSAIRACEATGTSTGPVPSLGAKGLTGSASGGSAALGLETLGLRAEPSGASARRVHCCSGRAAPECQDLPTLLRPARLGKSLSKGGCTHTYRQSGHDCTYAFNTATWKQNNSK